ncbi:MAG: 30S ribosomal protein S20 [Candidatus Rokubacteria bacterium]|nr:30S ribosomal protein S20 [Candidatus Rokubacteria bacterium]
MANTKSAIKRMKQSEKHRQRNRAVRSKLRSVVKSATTALGTQPAEAMAVVREAIRTLDRAVTQGVLHRNTAARKKSALARKLRAVK